MLSFGWFPGVWILYADVSEHSVPSSWADRCVILHAPTCLWRWNRQSVPKRRHIKFRRQGITQKKAYNNKTVLYVKTNRHFWSYFAQFFLEWKTFQTKVLEKLKTHILCSITLFRKSCRLWENVGKYCRAGQGHSAFRLLRSRYRQANLSVIWT